MTKKRLFSGIQPTGTIHIGNYLGALKNWVKLQDDYEAIYCIVDYHAITVAYTPTEMADSIFETAATLMAVGIDPKKCKLFVQSKVPAHTELAWILSSVTPLSHLERMTQFKDKSKQHAQNINLGLFSYPVLQTADIILYQATVVPVGEDQVQHLELCREISRKFNHRYGNVFPEAEALVGKGARIMSLTDPDKKMSKTMPDGCLFLTDSPEITEHKLKTAVTDPNRQRLKDPGNPDICNLFSLHQLFSSNNDCATINTQCRKAEIGCINCKQLLAAKINQELQPIRERYLKLKNDKKTVLDSLADGASWCNAIAHQTMIDVRNAMGL